MNHFYLFTLDLELGEQTPKEEPCLTEQDDETDGDFLRCLDRLGFNFQTDQEHLSFYNSCVLVTGFLNSDLFSSLAALFQWRTKQKTYFFPVALLHQDL